MNPSLRNLLCGVSLLTLLPSCGGAVGEKLRPSDHTASGALGGSAPTCAGAPKYAKPLIVDLDPDARVDLEATMKSGVAVVAYDCASFRVLSSCKVPESSAYEYAGVSVKEQLLQMNSVDDLQANMPISSAKLGAEVKSGRSIDLALVLVGRRSTTLAKVTRDDLIGSCDGATHFVQTATLGGFSMATGSIGKAAAVAEVFSYGGSAKSESERKAMNKDGSLEVCRKAEPDADKPPAECRAPLRVELSPIVGALVAPEKADKKGDKKDAVAVENPCPEGFIFSDGICTRNKGQAHQCDPKNEEECQTQCNKGSAESCFNYGILVKKGKKSAAAAMPFQKKACDGGFADGCAELGRAMMLNADGPDVAQLAKSALVVLNKGCDGGSALACDAAGDVYIEPDYKVRSIPSAMKVYDRACDLGRGIACWSLSEIYFKGNGVPKNPDMGVAYLTKACQGGDAGECDGLADIYAKGSDGVTQDINKAYRVGMRACSLDPAYCEDAAKYALGAGKEATAFKLAKRGCDAADEASCGVLGSYYQKGTGTSADPDKANEAWTRGCKNGKGDELSCKRIGVKMKY
jgi:TPR repeat protein